MTGFAEPALAVFNGGKGWKKEEGRVKQMNWKVRKERGRKGREERYRKGWEERGRMGKEER